MLIYFGEETTMSGKIVGIERVIGAAKPSQHQCLPPPFCVTSDRGADFTVDKLGT